MKSMTLNRGRDEYIPIKLKADWMGNPKGSRLTLLRSVAEQLIDRNAAKPLKDIPGTEEKRRKALRKPKRDKMVHGPAKGKSPDGESSDDDADNQEPNTVG